MALEPLPLLSSAQTLDPLQALIDSTRTASTSGEPGVDPLASLARSVAPPSSPARGRFANLLDAAQRHVTERLRIADAKSPEALRLSPATQLANLGTGSSARMFENAATGVRAGSLLLPDSNVDVEDPARAVQLAAAGVAAFSEGFATDKGVLRGLAWLARAQRSNALGRGAETALRLFGQGEDIGLARQIAGGAALAGTSEAALRAATGQSFEDIATGAGAVAALGFGLGGTAAALGGARARLFRPLTEPAPRVDLEVAPSPEELSELVTRFASTPASDPSAIARQNRLREITDKAARGETLDAVENEALRRWRSVAATEREAERVAREIAMGAAEAGRAPGIATALAAAPPVPPRAPGVEGIYGDASDPILDEARKRFEQTAIHSRPGSFVQSVRNRLVDAKERLANAFVFEREVAHFPSMQRAADGSRIPEMDFSDDLRALTHTLQRADIQAVDEVSAILDPILRAPDEVQRESFEGFNDLVILRDLRETAERGMATGALDLPSINALIADIESRAHPSVVEAIAMHDLATKRMLQALIERGKLPQGAGFDSYFPHQVLQSAAEAQHFLETGQKLTKLHPTFAALQKGALKEPFRPYALKREGSTRPILADYEEIMSAAFRRFHRDNTIDDFLGEVKDNFHSSRADLRAAWETVYGPELASKYLDDLDTFGRVRLPDGETLVSFSPKGRSFYRAFATDEAGKRLYDDLRRGEVEAGVEVPELREVFAVGRESEMILPEALGHRLERFYAPEERLPSVLRRPTAAWKSNVTRWGGMAFSMMNLIGDSVNLTRSNPKAWSQVAKMIRAQFAHYRTPMLSPQQLASGLLGGVSGDLTAQGLGDEDGSFMQRAGAILTGAGLGYIVGSTGLRLGGRQLLPSKVGTAAPKPALEALYDEMDRIGAINSGFIHHEEELNRRILREAENRHPRHNRDFAQRAWDTIATAFTGKGIGNPANVLKLRSIVETMETLVAERENLLRGAFYLQDIADGVPAPLAAKHANLALVDYARVTKWEDTWVRSFLLPFYTWTRHNTENWIRTIAGRDVGGRPKVALLAAAGMGAFDIAAQQWNAQLFGEVEARLPEYTRSQFHIIVGDPTTGQAFADRNGKPMVVGLELPYESVLELLGLARPGVVVSELTGTHFNREQSLIGRVRDAEGWQKLSEGAKAPLLGFWREFSSLVSPFIKVPVELASNESIFTGAPIAPERYVGTPVEHERMLNYIADTFFRQVREGRKVVRASRSGRFEPASSAFGLGLPIQYVDPNRQAQGRLHELMDAAEATTRAARAQWTKPLDDLFYARENFSEAGPNEVDVLRELIMESPDEATQEAIFRYYIERAAKSSVTRRWENMSWSERAELVKNAREEPGMWTALFFYLNGGKDIGDVLREQGALPPKPNSN